MPKKKNYQALRFGHTPNCAGEQSTPKTEDAGAGTKSARCESDADIDYVAVLGPDARFSDHVRTMILSRALGCGIDEWVFASADAIRMGLLAGGATGTATNYGKSMLAFFEFLKVGATLNILSRSRPATPGDLKPLHVKEFVAWLKKKGVAEGWVNSTVRGNYNGFKAIVQKMLALRLIEDKSYRLFARGDFGRDDKSRITSLSDAEQERLAGAVKADLSAIHHRRLVVTMRELQSLRLLVIAHRMGHSTTPLLELKRTAIRPGLLPGTILVQTVKHRSKKIKSQAGLAGPAGDRDHDTTTDRTGAMLARLSSVEVKQAEATEVEEVYLPFSLAEGAVIGQAIASTEHLVARAPKRLQDRVWLYEASKNTGTSTRKGDVTALSTSAVLYSIKTLVKRHKLKGDDGKTLVVNNSRLRKSRFDRAFRIADGDLSVTANLMGNTPSVAGTNYPSMNAARQAEAAGYLNEDYIPQMKGRATQRSKSRSIKEPTGLQESMRVVEIRPASEVQTSTPVSGCGDLLQGEHAPKNGTLCDRFVMCLFCSSFVIVGTVDELWRLFSFQVFAKSEQDYLDERLGGVQEEDAHLADLQNLLARYRLAIPYIDSFTKKQFAASCVKQARRKTAAGIHPFWISQIAASRRARSNEADASDQSD